MRADSTVKARTKLSCERQSRKLLTIHARRANIRIQQVGQTATHVLSRRVAARSKQVDPSPHNNRRQSPILS